MFPLSLKCIAGYDKLQSKVALDEDHFFQAVRYGLQPGKKVTLNSNMNVVIKLMLPNL